MKTFRKSLKSILNTVKSIFVFFKNYGRTYKINNFTVTKVLLR